MSINKMEMYIFELQNIEQSREWTGRLVIKITITSLDKYF